MSLTIDHKLKNRPYKSLFEFCLPWRIMSAMQAGTTAVPSAKSLAHKNHWMTFKRQEDTQIRTSVTVQDSWAPTSVVGAEACHLADRSALHPQGARTRTLSFCLPGSPVASSETVFAAVELEGPQCTVTVSRDFPTVL